MAIVHESSATAASATCNKPTGTATGDVLVAVALSQSAAASLAGWTAQVTVDYSATYYTTILTRVVDGSEGATFTFGGAGTVYSVGISRFSGVDTTSPINGTPTSNVGLLAPAVLPAITTTDDDAMLVMACGAFPATGGITVTEVTFSAGTERWATGDPYGVGTRTELATELIASAGSTGTRTITPTMSDASAYYLALSGMLALTPAAAGGVTVSAALAGNTTRARIAPSSVTGAARAIVTALPNTTRARIAPAAVRGSARAIITALPNTTRTRLAPSSVTGAARAIITAMPGTTRTVLAATAFERVHVTVTPSLLAGVTHDLLAPTVVFGSTVTAPMVSGATHDVLPVGSVGVGATITPDVLSGVTRDLLAPDILTGATMVASVAGGISRALYAPTVGVLLPRQTFDGSVLTTDGASPVRGVSSATNGIRGRTTDGVPGVRGRLP